MLKTPSSTVIGGAGIWTPSAWKIGLDVLNLGQLIRNLFSNSEQGFAYDINDLSTLYQDAAGTTPVTAAGQPVGLMLDKSNGLVVGNNINSNTWVTEGGWTILDGKAYHVSGSALGGLYQINTPVNSKFYKLKFSIIVRSGGLTISRNGTSVISINSSGTYEIVLKPNQSANTRLVDFYTNSTLFDGEIDLITITIKELAGNHAYQTNAASRPLLQRNATTGAYYLAFDGIDDFLVTNPIDFTATDKVSLFAGVRKLSDATTGTVVELSPAAYNSVGSFGMFTASSAGSPDFLFRSSGTLFNASVAVNNNAAPKSAVLVGQAQIGTDTLKIKVNSTQNSSSTDQGTGNYGNYSLYIGRREGKFFSLNGHLYSLIGVGRLSTDAETTNLEKAIAKNVGVTL